MKKALFVFTAAAAILAGCQMADDFAPKSDKNARTPLTFTASIENSETRAALVAEGDTYHATWQIGDRIEIKGYIESNEGRDIYSAAEGGSSYTYFSFFTGDTLNAGPYEAYSPVNAGVAFPGTQSQVGSVCQWIPMRAYNPDGTNLQFKNLGGLLKLNIKTAEAGIVVKQVIVTADQPMAGKYTLDGDAAVVAADGQKSIILDCIDGIAIGNDPVPFFVSVPANTYTGMTIQIVADGGKKSNVIKMKIGSSVKVERSKYYEADFSFDKFESITVGGVALLPEGPEFNAAIKQQSQNDELLDHTAYDYIVSKIVFETNSANTAGENIADLSSDQPVYLSVDPASGIALVSTPASQFKLPANASNMFAYFGGLEEIVNLKSVNTDDVEDMSFMFCFLNCDYTSLKSLDVSGFKTDNVTTMRSMFNACNKITELDVSSFNTENVEEMQFMFQYCRRVKTLDLTHFNTEAVKDMSYMFAYCNDLEALDLSSFNTENVASFSYTFYYCTTLQTLDLSSFDTSAATNMGRMFCDCRGLMSLNVTSFDTTAATEIRSFFNRCYELREIDVSSFDLTNFTSTDKTGYFFYTARNLRKIICNDGFKWNLKPTYFPCASNSKYEDRPGSATGTLDIICDQDEADWFATTGFRWLHNGTPSVNADPINVRFYDWKTGVELFPAEWKAN